MKTTSITAISLCALAAAPVLAQSSDAAKPQEQFISSVTDDAAFGGEGYTTTDGEQIYATFCAGCHMPGGGGATGAGAYPALTGNPNLEYASYPITVIVNGQAGMPSLGNLLSDEQVVAVTSYIQSDLDNGYEPDATVQMVADTRPAEPEQELAEHEVAQTETPAEDGSGIVRHPIPDSDFPILLAAEIPADATLVYLSGTVPQVIDESAEQGSPERFGDTTAQTVSTLESIQSKLDSLDLEMGDVFKMQVYLVAPEGGDGMDFGAFMEGYTQFFGTEDQPNLPTRSVFEVAGLANPSWLVEIEVVAVRP